MNSIKVQSEASINVVVLDVTPQTWLKAGIETFQSVVDSVAGYCRALLLMNPSTEVAVLAVYPGSAEFVWISSSPPSSPSTAVQQRGATRHLPYSTETTVTGSNGATTYVSYTDDKTFSAVSVLEEELKTRLSQLGSSTHCAQDTFPSLDIALSKALCFINRKRVDFSALAESIHVFLSSPVEARILCVCASRDSDSQYVPVMNAVFAAQKDKIPIDTCFLKMVSPPSVYLKHASYITENSVYLEHDSAEGLLQLMIVRIKQKHHFFFH